MKKILLALIVCTTLFSSGLSYNLGASNNIKEANFEINVSDITPGSVELIGAGAGETIDNVLLTILEKLIVVFGVFAVFIMTLGAGYMIIYHGQDEFLSKGKSIFMSGIIALAVALSAGVIVKLFAYLLY
ncbi:hypothetical protein LR010_02660 [Candidatus Gracilibacteria bacterium]|nr:hypothetical protein [Candidatus Gracilibacteria bacterium]